MNRPKLYSAAATTLIAILLGIWLTIGELSFDTGTLRQPPRPTTGIIADEEFVDTFDPISRGLDPAPSEADTRRTADAAPTSGNDIADASESAESPTHATSTLPSPLSRTSDTKRPSGPVDNTEQQQQEARRRATSDTRSAFRKTEGRDNTTDRTKQQHGDSGSPEGATSQANGAGTGSVSGGWQMPKYAKVPSTVTGSIILRASVDRNGRAKDIEQTGGEPPAATDRALVRACIAEVSSKTFTRSDNEPPEHATATITYRFK